MLQKFKSFLSNDAVFYGFLLVGVSVASFGLGRQSVLEANIDKSVVKQAEFVERGSAPEAPTPTPLTPVAATAISSETVDGEVVASKSGSKYHLPTCPGAAQIKAENLISFASVAAAEAAGYAPAANCKGLQ